MGPWPGVVVVVLVVGVRLFRRQKARKGRRELVMVNRKRLPAGESPYVSVVGTWNIKERTRTRFTADWIGRFSLVTLEVLRVR